MVRETRYLGDNAEQFLPPNRRVRSADFDDGWVPGHRPEEGAKTAGNRRGKQRKGKPKDTRRNALQ